MPLGADGVPPMSSLPHWVVMHVPHDSMIIPEDVRGQFVLNDLDLDTELLRMTDHHTHQLIASDIPENQVVRAPVSRLVVDVERFEDDDQEKMAERGMGAVYSRTHDLRKLRHPMTNGDRQDLLERFYRPHHKQLQAATDLALSKYGKAFIIDVHSFPSKPWPYELDQNLDRPEICIGTDDFHTPSSLTDAVVNAFRDDGFIVGVNAPFAGALVPMSQYRKNKAVSAIMLEVRRDLYVDETTGSRNNSFLQIAQRIRKCFVAALVETG